MVVDRFAAVLAFVHRLHVGGEQPALAAIRAFGQEAPAHRRHQRTGRAQRLFAPAKDLFVHLDLLAREACRLLRAPAAERFLALWKERFPAGKAFGSVNISKRNAPASGATSTSLTSTRSAS